MGKVKIKKSAVQSTRSTKRANPMSGPGGFTGTRQRYPCGGKIKK